MRVGEVRHEERARWGKPLAGVRVLAAEQMQALPFATQLMAHLGADVVKVEPPGQGDSGRLSQPAITDTDLLVEIARDYDAERIEAFPVDRAVGSARAQGPQLVAPILPAKDEP